MENLDKDVIVVEGDDNTVLVIEKEVHIVTDEVPIEIQTNEKQENVVVVFSEDNSIITEEDIVNVVTDDEPTALIADISVGPQGPPGPPGPPGGGGAVAFIVGITSTGIVGNIVYDPDTVPSNYVIERASTDTDKVTIHFVCSGPVDNYSPTATVNGVEATISETTTKRWFSGEATVSLVSGINTVTVTTSAGAVATAIVELLGAGPKVLSVSFGPYPNSQTELKEGDIISVSVTTEPEATHVTLVPGGAQNYSHTYPVINGVANFAITINNASGQQPIYVKAKNSFGTYGDVYTSDTLNLNQTHPTFGPFEIIYPSGKNALGINDKAQVKCVVSNFDEITYTSPHFSIPSSNQYSETKTITNSYNGYVYSGENYTITAKRRANGAISSASTLVKISSTAPEARIVITPSGRLVSSPIGIGYTVTIIPTQKLIEPPSLNASLGEWTGQWTQDGNNWKRMLMIYDSTPRGTGVFNNLTLKNEALVTGNTIISGSIYTVGGFSSRVVTFPPFSRVALLGVNVADETKTSAQFVGGTFLVRYSDNDNHLNGYYIANSDGTYNPNGDHIGLSDSAFAGANTSGTLQLIVQEVA